MCKSASQPGGPYRCSGDMERRLTGARSAYSEAQKDYLAAGEDIASANMAMTRESMAMARQVESPTAPYVREGKVASASEHIEAMVKAGELSPAARDMNPSQAFEQYGDVNALDSDDPTVPQFDRESANEDYKAADQRWSEANAKRNQALADRDSSYARTQAASKDVIAAQANYDATPRGLGELQAEADKADRAPVSKFDAATAQRERERLQQRIDSAQATMSSEAETRFANDTARGGEPKRFTYQPLSTNPPSGGSGGAGNLAADDGITGCAKVYAPPSGSSEVPCKVTLTRRASDGKAVEATFSSTVNASQAGSLSTGTVLGGLSERARQVDAAGNDFETWRAQQGHPSREESISGHTAAREAFDGIQRDSFRLGQFVGASRFFTYATRG